MCGILSNRCAIVLGTLLGTDDRKVLQWHSPCEPIAQVAETAILIDIVILTAASRCG